MIGKLFPDPEPEPEPEEEEEDAVLELDTVDAIEAFGARIGRASAAALRACTIWARCIWAACRRSNSL